MPSNPSSPILKERGILTGIPFLDRMLTNDVNPKCSIYYPGEWKRRMNILIKGDTGSGKSILSLQIAFNLMNNIRSKELEESLAKYNLEIINQQESYIQEPSLDIEAHNSEIMIPLYFAFEQTVEEIEDCIKNLFLGRSKNTDIMPLIFCLKKHDARHRPTVNELKDYITFIQHIFFTEINSSHTVYNQIDNMIKQVSAKFPELETNFNYSVIENEHPFHKKIQKLAQQSQKELNFILFIDSINIFFEEHDDRNVLFDLLSISQHLESIMFLILEDYSSTNKEEFLYLAKTLEFQSDIIIHLTYTNNPYYTNYIEIVKNKNTKQIYGKHLFKINSKESIIPEIDARKGIIIYPSIHTVLTESREIPHKNEDYEPPIIKSGIVHLDAILRGSADENAKLLEKDALLIIEGDKGGHKLALAFNILLGGLIYEINNNVLIISFEDEDTIDVGNIARGISPLRVCKKNENKGCFDTALKILNVTASNTRLDSQKEAGKIKIFKHKVLVTKKYPESDSIEVINNIIEVALSPGYLSVEELLFIIKGLIYQYKPSRVLIDNTNLIKMRFPEIYKEKMIFAALVGLLKHHRIMTILIDVTGRGSDIELSYTLRGMADYIFSMETINGLLQKNEIIRKKILLNNKPILLVSPDLIENFTIDKNDKNKSRLQYNLSFLSIANIRNKVYKNSIHGIMALSAQEAEELEKNNKTSPIPKTNLKSTYLYIFDIDNIPDIQLGTLQNQSRAEKQ